MKELQRKKEQLEKEMKKVENSRQAEMDYNWKSVPQDHIYQRVLKTDATPLPLSQALSVGETTPVNNFKPVKAIQKPSQIHGSIHPATLPSQETFYSNLTQSKVTDPDRSQLFMHYNNEKAKKAAL